MFYFRIGSMLVLCVLLATDALARAETKSTYAQPIGQPKPDFPMLEIDRGREGWVVVNYVVNEDGVVVDPSIEDSSGSEYFNEAALKAVRDWRYEPAEKHKSSAILNFVYHRKQVHLSKKFFFHDAKVHESIDNGELDDAQERIDEHRNNGDPSAVELAYSFIAEGRIAGERGDQVEQLRCFRRAMINYGRWLKRENYLKLLYATIVLEMQQQDFSSALRDYALLTETNPGRKIAADLEAPIEGVRGLVESDSNIAPPYMAANIEMSITHERRNRGMYGGGEATGQERSNPTPPPPPPPPPPQ